MSLYFEFKVFKPSKTLKMFRKSGASEIEPVFRKNSLKTIKNVNLKYIV